MPRMRPRPVLAALALCGLLAVGCTTPSNEPGDYDDTTRRNFLEGCTGIVTEGTGQDASTSSIGEGADLATCECQYDWFVQNVPFDSDAAEAAGLGPDAPNFVELNRQVQDDPNSLPEDIRQAMQACADGTAGGGGEAQSGAAPGDGAGTSSTAEPQGDTSTSAP